MELERDIQSKGRSVADLFAEVAPAQPIQVTIEANRSIVLMEFRRPTIEEWESAKSEAVKAVERSKSGRVPEEVRVAMTGSHVANGYAHLLAKFDAGGYSEAVLGDDGRYIGSGERLAPMTWPQWMVLFKRLGPGAELVYKSFEIQAKDASDLLAATEFESEKKGSKATQSTESASE